MPTLPKELRERVHEAWSDGDTVKDVAETFRVGTATVKRWVRLKRETGALEPLPRTYGFAPFATEERKAILREIVAEHSDWSQERIAELWSERCGAKASQDMVGRALASMGITRKKSPSMRSSATRRG